MEDIVFELIDDHVDGADMYTYSGSIWMIFTDEKKWIIELTKEGTLWYNYYFFKNLFKYVSMDDIEYQDYITKWVEKTIQNGVRHNGAGVLNRVSSVEKTIQNGVRHNNAVLVKNVTNVENTIQNGVKHAISEINQDILWVEKTIQNGMKHTQWPLEERKNKVEDTIQNGIRHTNLEMNHQPMTVLRVIEDGIRTTYPEYNDMSERVEKVVKETELHKGTRPAAIEHTIRYGVKKTKPMDEWVNTERIIEKTIQEGIKQTKTPGKDGDIVSVTEFMKEHNSNNVPKMIDEIIENGIKKTEGGMLFDESKIDTVISEGIKEVKELPDKSGELRGYGDYYRRQKDMAKPHTLYVKDVIDNGIKKTISGHPDKKEFVEKVVLQHGIKETWGYEKQSQIKIDNVINNGIKDTIGLNP